MTAAGATATRRTRRPGVSAGGSPGRRRRAARRWIQDAVQGEVKVSRDAVLDDMILLRADGTPTYMLAVVVNNHDMDVTQIIRGDDHLTNNVPPTDGDLLDAMGWDAPGFAHIPLILGSDGAKLSKRHGALGVQE